MGEDIRYIKLHFTFVIMEDTEMPVYKTSMFRGGMGEMLLRKNCIRDRKCEACDFESECLVRRTMYSKMEIQPKFMTAGDSVGYIVECEDYRENLFEGDEIKLNLILFGKNIVYFNQYLDAFYTLGQIGVGKMQSRYAIKSITNSKGQSILEDYNVQMSRYEIQGVRDYAAYRMAQLKRTAPDKLCIKLQTPLALKKQGKLMENFDMEVFLNAVRRRLYMLNCFEGIESDANNIYPGEVPLYKIEELYQNTVPRYSFRKQEKMNLRGFRGSIIMEIPSEEILRLLLIGELIHVGGNTSFGFGRYHIS